MPGKHSPLSKMRNFVGPRLVKCRAARGLALAGLVAVTTPAAVAGAAQAAGGAAQAAGAGAQAAGGGEAQQVTDYPLDVGSLKVSPSGDLLALSMEVFPDCPTLGCTRERLDARAKDKAVARIYERMFVRHWDTWSNGTRSHLFTQP